MRPRKEKIQTEEEKEITRDGESKSQRDPEGNQANRRQRTQRKKKRTHRPLRFIDLSKFGDEIM